MAAGTPPSASGADSSSTAATTTTDCGLLQSSSASGFCAQSSTIPMGGKRAAVKSTHDIRQFFKKPRVENQPE